MKFLTSEDNGVLTLRRDDCAICARVLVPKGGAVERRALEQLMSMSDQGVGIRSVTATPDLHPSHPVPVGSIFVTDADTVLPAAIGKDINCGMRLVHFDIDLLEWQEHESVVLPALREVLVDAHRNVPVPGEAFAALAEEGGLAFTDALDFSGPFWQAAGAQGLRDAWLKSPYQHTFRGASRWLPSWMTESGRAVREAGFATLGSGNHFFEFQVVDQISNGPVSWANGIRRGQVHAMVHTGSRDIGSYVGGQWMQWAREAWPASTKYPEHGIFPLRGAQAAEYLQAMSAAAHYAWANRCALTELARQALCRALARNIEMTTVADVPHNVIMQEGDVCVHRKGATPAHEGALALIPGSMGDYSYVMQGLGNPLWASSCSHGAGRQLARGESRHDATEASTLPFKIIAGQGARIREEMPGAYKNVRPVIEAQVEHGLVSEVARMTPIATFKM
jgi:tRNA-splicing ligase RtcB (3'-phosphate/5'-hydroxy nucleic acid ligase)